jgi:L-rhamnose mutarotase
MQRVCFLLHIRPGKLEEYKARHRAVWPEMIQALRDSGWNNYSLFLTGDGLLIGYLETDNFQQAVAKMCLLEVNRLWQQEMAPFFVLPNGEAPDQWMTPIEEIFYIDNG